MNYVLISTYNGEKYITEQLDSIANQNWDGQCNIFIRDDGSTDNTIKILLEKKKEYETLDVELTIIKGKNIGVIESFHSLCKTLNTFISENDLIFFSDQDDVWLTGRYEKIISAFEGSKIDLYCSALNLVNDQLESIGSFNHKYFLGRDKLFPLLANYITGCSLCIKGKVFKKLNFDVPSNEIPMHDWWIAIQAYFYSFNVFYDKETTVLYRQHSGNVVGITSVYKRLISLSFWNKRFKQSAKVTQISLLDETIINDDSLLTLKKYVEYNYQNLLGRIKICLKYFDKASVTRWIIFVFFK